MIKVKYTDGSVEEFKADDWEVGDDTTDLTREEEGDEKIVAVVFNRNVFSIQ